MRILIGLLSLVLAACGSATGGSLEPGAAAPPLSLPGSDGKTYDLADFAGQRAVVIAWLPKAFTGR